MFKLLNRPMAPAGEADTGGDTATLDRGDDFTPTEEEEKTEEKTREKAEEKVKEETEEETEKKVDEKSEAKPDEKDKKEKPKDTRIPLARHETILARERAQREALAAKLAKYEQGDRLAATNTDIAKGEANLNTLEEKYTKQLADGDVKDAQATMKEIRLLERSISEAKSDMKIQAATVNAIESVRYDTVLERIEEAYPALNQDHDDFDKDVMTEVVEMMTGFTLQGQPRSAALQKAVKYVMRGVETTAKQDIAVNVKPRVDESEAAKAARKAAAVAKNVDAAAKTPASTTKIGKDSDKAGGAIVDAKMVMKMSQDDFAKLDEAALSKMRGDDL